jgi:regulator of protease activity HflC (stomatin/prohibitin superfamily)
VHDLVITTGRTHGRDSAAYRLRSLNVPEAVRPDRWSWRLRDLPESMKRSVSRQAEAERERRVRIIAADGEYQAAKKLAQAATVMAADPAARPAGQPASTAATTALNGARTADAVG